jgi:FkbM family methyltransferase
VSTFSRLAGRAAKRGAAPLQRSTSPAAARAVASVLKPLSRSASPRAQAAARSMTWWAPRGVASVASTFDGVRFELDLRDNLQRELFYSGTYESNVHELLVRSLGSGDVIVDVGANIGVHSLPLARRVRGLGGLVLAFEPAADTAARLRTTATRNGIDVEVVPIALGRNPGTATLRQSTAWEQADLGVRSLFGDGDAVAPVQVVRFDDWAAARPLARLDIVKIDVEGGEMDVLAGMTASLRSLCPRLIVVEVVEKFLRRSGTSSAALDEFLSTHGYRTDGPAVSEIVQGAVGPWWPNAVYRPA